MTSLHGDFISLTAAGADSGPFSIILDSRPGGHTFRQILSDNHNGIVVAANERELRIGRLHVSLEDALVWDPLLPKGLLLGKPVQSGIDHMSVLLSQWAPQGSLPAECRREDVSPIGARIQLAWREIGRAISYDIPSLGFAGARLAAGAGIGLTPAGDDFLVGVVLAFWLGMREPERHVNELIAGATGRTGQLPMALLRAAGRGEASLAWRGLVDALLQDDTSMLDTAVHELLSVGHTSGADALFGFIVTLQATRQPFEDYSETPDGAGFGFGP